MATGATGQLGLALPVQGELSGTWGDTVNNGITQYTNIAIAATLTLTNDGAVTLANTTGDAAASNIVSSLTGAGTVTAQFAIVRVTGTLTTAKVVTAPSYSKTYTVVNAATGGVVTFKASGQTGVSIAVGESAFVYFNGTDYVKLAGTVAGTLAVANGGTGQTSYTDGQLLIGNTTGNTLTKATLTAGSGISITNGTGSITIANTASVSAATPTALGTVYGDTASGTPFETMLGYQAGNATTGINNTFVGYQAGLVNGTGFRNTALGASALVANTSGRYNTAIGNDALPANTTSHYSTAVGYQAGLVNTQAALVAIGAQSLAANTTGDSNTACGYSALKTNITGNYNTGIGREALTLSTGTDNTALGYLAGSSITTGSNNIVIGSSAAASSATVSNEVTLGNTSIVSTRLRGIVEHNMAIFEQATISATAATGTIAYYAQSQSVLYYTSNASANWTVNIRASAGTTLNTAMQTGQSMTVAFLVTQGSTAYYNSAVQVDGSAVTPKWQGGTAPTAGNASSIDVYVYTVIKTGSAAFTVLASQTKFA